MDHLHQAFRLAAFPSITALDAAVRAPAHEADDPLSWESLSATATLVLTPSGGPIRTIVTGRRLTTTGAYASRKAGRALPYESMNERAFFMHSEVDTDVVDYRAQPFRFEFILDGQKRTYIVDCVRLLAGGEVEVVEIKNDRRALKDPDYRLKLEAVRLICHRIGWRFRVVFKPALFEPEETYRSIVDIQSWAFTEVTSADVFGVVDQLDRHGAMALGRLAEQLGERSLGVAKLKAMMVGRIVRLDLASPLNNETRVELVDDQPEVLQ